MIIDMRSERSGATPDLLVLRSIRVTKVTHRLKAF